MSEWFFPSRGYGETEGFSNSGLEMFKDSQFAQWREKSVKIHWMQSETATSLSGKSLNVYLSIPQQIFQE